MWGKLEYTCTLCRGAWAWIFSWLVEKWRKIVYREINSVRKSVLHEPSYTRAQGICTLCTLVHRFFFSACRGVCARPHSKGKHIHETFFLSHGKFHYCKTPKIEPKCTRWLGIPLTTQCHERSN